MQVGVISPSQRRTDKSEEKTKHPSHVMPSLCLPVVASARLLSVAAWREAWLSSPSMIAQGLACGAEGQQAVGHTSPAEVDLKPLTPAMLPRAATHSSPSWPEA
jgi:hypothetical protein